MLKSVMALAFLLGLTPVLCGASVRPEAIRFEFNDAGALRKEWDVRGVQLRTNRTNYDVCREDSASDGWVLRVSCNRSSGILVSSPDYFNLADYPIMRWRWRVVKPLQLSGEKPEPDDQALVIYIGDGNPWRQYSIAYRWEHNVPLLFEKNQQYCGVTSTWSVCLRNCETTPGEWVTETRNVAQDFKKAYGRVPNRYFVLGIGGNTQYTRSQTIAEIDYIEFLPAGTDTAVGLK